jgi:hypothetical protein
MTGDIMRFMDEKCADVLYLQRIAWIVPYVTGLRVLEIGFDSLEATRALASVASHLVTVDQRPHREQGLPPNVVIVEGALDELHEEPFDAVLAVTSSNFGIQKLAPVVTKLLDAHGLFWIFIQPDDEDETIIVLKQHFEMIERWCQGSTMASVFYDPHLVPHKKTWQSRTDPVSLPVMGMLICARNGTLPLNPGPTISLEMSSDPSPIVHLQQQLGYAHRDNALLAEALHVRTQALAECRLALSKSETFGTTRTQHRDDNVRSIPGSLKQSLRALFRWR